MTTTNFVDQQTVIQADWLNDVDAHIYNQDVDPHPQYTTDAVLSANSGASLIGYTQGGTGAVNSTVQAKLRETISVKDFGATGDGVTNDTAAIHSARDAAGTGGTVYVPEGDYLISGVVLNVASQAWIFENNAKLIRNSGTGGSTLSITAASVQVSGAYIDGKRATVASGSGLDITTAGTSCILDNITIVDAKVFGMYIEGADVIIRNCTVISSESLGIFVINNISNPAVGPRIYNNLVDQSALASTVLTGGIFIRGNSTGPQKWLTGNITNNKIVLTSNPSVSTVGIEVIYSDKILINNNYVSGGYIAISSGNVQDATINSNVVYGPNQIGIEVARSSIDVVVDGNSIDGLSLMDNGIEISSSSNQSSRITVSNNSVRRVLATTGNCISNLNCIELLITGNQLRPDSGNAGIYSQSAISVVGYLVISNNVIQGNGTATYGIQIDTPIGIQVLGNNISNVTTAIRLQCSTASSLAANLIANNEFIGITNTIQTSLAGGAAWVSSNRWMNNVGYVINSRAANVMDVLNNICDIWGGGAPEGVVTASPGSTYHRIDGAAGQGLYIKESGTSNTGWIAK